MPNPNARKPWWWGLAAALIAGISWYVNQHQRGALAPPVSRSEGTATTENHPSPTDDSLPALIRARRAEGDTSTATVVESSGMVVKVLPDDTEGDRHQRLLVRISSGDTVLIAHNIDIAPRIEVRQGDAIRFKGEYIWNDRGGVIHWTHRDPRHRHSDGWLEANGRRVE
jgi:hypothetical protein